MIYWKAGLIPPSFCSFQIYAGFIVLRGCSLLFTIQALVTFFTIIDPVGLAPIFIGLTAHQSDAQRQRVVTRAVLISAGIIAFFALVGRFLLNSLGINLYAFNIAGGALLFLVAVDMLFGRPSGTRETQQEEEEAMTREDISVFPLAIPMIAGPGTIATTIVRNVFCQLTSRWEC